MSTRSLNRIETSTSADSSFQYLNRGLQLAGLFLFINGIYVAFFSDSLFTTFGYYFVVIAAICVTLSRIISPENPLVPKRLQSAVQQQLSRTKTETNAKSGSRRERTKRRNGFDIRRYLRAVLQKLRGVDFSDTSSGRNGRDRL